MRKLIRVSRAAADGMLGLIMNGLSATDARRVLELWFERCEKLGPFNTYKAAHELDHWARLILEQLEFREDAIMRRYLEQPSGSRPKIRKRRNSP